MKLTTLALALVGGLTLASCSQSDDPLGDVCKQIATELSGNPHVDWENPERVVDDGELRIDLFSPQTTASCFFKPTVKDPTVTDFIESDYESSPYKMLLNGVYVPEAELLKASMSAMAKDTKQGTLQAMKDAKEKANDAVEQTRKAAEAAETKIREVLEK